MTFSIVTAVLNGWPHVRQCVGSVRGQRGVRVQHLVQDGGSADGTAAWLLKQADLDARSEPDQGMYDAIQRGWKRATGDIVAWINADEQYLPDTLNYVQQVFESRPEIDAVFGDAIIVDARGEPVAARREIPLRAAYVRNGFLYALSCTLFFRRRLLDGKLLTLNTRYRIAADMDLMLGLLEAKARIWHLPRYVALFGVSGRNLSVAPLAEKEIAEIRERFGALPSALQPLVLAGRWLERWARGCYREGDLAYDYALDDVPTYRRIERKGVGSHFSYEDHHAE